MGWIQQTTSGGSSNVDSFVQPALPVLIAPASTVSANGALTLGTALPIALPKLFLYFTAGAVFSGSPAGAYYCEMTTTTAGTIFNNRYTSGTPSVPISKTAIVDAGPGAYAGTLALINLLSIIVPAVSQKEFRIKSEFCLIANSTVNAKLFSTIFAGNAIDSSTLSTSTVSGRRENTILTLGDNAVILAPPQGTLQAGPTTNTNASGPQQYNVDLTVTQTLILQGQLSVVSDLAGYFGVSVYRQR